MSPRYEIKTEIDDMAVLRSNSADRVQQEGISERSSIQCIQSTDAVLTLDRRCAGGGLSLARRP